MRRHIRVNGVLYEAASPVEVRDFTRQDYRDFAASDLPDGTPPRRADSDTGELSAVISGNIEDDPFDDRTVVFLSWSMDDGSEGFTFRIFDGQADAERAFEGIVRELDGANPKDLSRRYRLHA